MTDPSFAVLCPPSTPPPVSWQDYAQLQAELAATRDVLQQREDELAVVDDAWRRDAAALRASRADVARLHDAVDPSGQIERLKAGLAGQWLGGYLGGRPQWMNTSGWAEQQYALEQAVYRLRKLEIEGVRRWAGGFSCLCFSIVGAAVAIRFRFTDSCSIFMFCFIPILVIYYPILAAVSDGVRAGRLPPITLWASNLVTFAAGMALLRSVLKH